MFTNESTVNSSSVQFGMNAVVSAPSKSAVLSSQECSKLEESLRRHDVSLRLLGQ